MRHTYLRSIRKFREEGRPIVYLDETWLNTNHVARGYWVDCPRTSTSAFESHRGGHGRFVPSGKGSRLIIVDAGFSAVGMIPGSALIFESKTGNQDYHDEMNSENFTKCFTEQLLPNLPANSVIVRIMLPITVIWILSLSVRLRRHRRPRSSLGLIERVSITLRE